MGARRIFCKGGPGGLGDGILVRFLLVVQLMMQIEFCICNFEHDYLDG